MHENKLVKEFVVTLQTICIKPGFFTYDPENKRQSMHWKSLSSTRVEEAQLCESKFKAMKIVFFDIHGIVYLNRVPEGQTGNQHYHFEVLA